MVLERCHSVGMLAAVLVGRRLMRTSTGCGGAGRNVSDALVIVGILLVIPMVMMMLRGRRRGGRRR